MTEKVCTFVTFHINNMIRTKCCFIFKFCCLFNSSWLVLIRKVCSCFFYKIICFELIPVLLKITWNLYLPFFKQNLISSDHSTLANTFTSFSARLPLNISTAAKLFTLASLAYAKKIPAEKIFSVKIGPLT